MKALSELGTKTTLRYAVQLLNPAYQLAKAYRYPAITTTVLDEAKELFSDAKQSALLLSTQAGSAGFMK